MDPGWGPGAHQSHSHSSPLSSTGGWGMETAVNSSHVVSAAPSSSGGGLLTLFLHSNVGSFSRETVLHQLLQRESFPRAAVLHQLLQRGSLPWGADLQEQTAPAWVPHGVRSPASKPAPVWAPLSMGPQVLPGACSSVGFPRATASFRFLHLALAWGPPQATGGISAPLSSFLHGLQGDSLLHHGLHHGLQGDLCSGAWSTSCPSFCTDLGVCRVPYIFSLLSPAAKAPPTLFFPFVTMLSQRR